MTTFKIHAFLLIFSLLSLNFFEIDQEYSAKPSFLKKDGDIQNIVIEGTVSPEEQHSYRLEPFFVPENIGAIEVNFEYSGKNEYSEMEIGLFDPHGFRGTSRFSKDLFYISKIRATASYSPGPIVRGEWNISLGFPTIRQRSEYKVTIRLIPENHPEFTGPSNISMKKSKQWYSGDFHTHTGHSDGFGCNNMDGNRAPCQVYQVVEAANNIGLDFVSITDHNTVSHHQDITVLQPLFSNLLLIRGQELTTFYGHANVYGTSNPIDFRIGFEDRTFRHIQREVDSLGALLSINHPGRETGASCTGCGWSAKSTDYNQVQVVEVVNGTNVENDIAGIPFWHNLLNNGYKITGIGGSDDHSAGTGNSQPGIPTTMVYSNSLSEKAILDGVLMGKVYLKTRGPNGPEVSFHTISKNNRWTMGDTIDLNSLENSTVEIAIEYTHPTKQEIELIFNGEILDLDVKQIHEMNHKYRVVGEFFNPSKGWLRFNLRDEKGITVISNPIYLE